MEFTLHVDVSARREVIVAALRTLADLVERDHLTYGKDTSLRVAGELVGEFNIVED